MQLTLPLLTDLFAAGVVVAAVDSGSTSIVSSSPSDVGLTRLLLLLLLNLFALVIITDVDRYEDVVVVVVGVTEAHLPVQECQQATTEPPLVPATLLPAIGEVADRPATMYSPEVPRKHTLLTLVLLLILLLPVL